MKRKPLLLPSLALVAVLFLAGCVGSGTRTALRPGPVHIAEPPPDKGIIYLLVWNTSAVQGSFVAKGNGTQLIALKDRTYVKYTCTPGDLKLTVEPVSAEGARAAGSVVAGTVVGGLYSFFTGPIGPAAGLISGVMVAKDTHAINRALQQQDSDLILKVEPHQNYFVALDLQLNRPGMALKIFELDQGQARQRMMASREVFPTKLKK